MYAYTQGQPKAVMEMNGRPMLEYVVAAVQGSKHIEDVAVVGLGSDLGMSFARPVHHIPDQGGMISNTVAGLKWAQQNRPQGSHVFGLSADVPLLTTEMVDYLIEQCQPLTYGVYYNFVTKETMEKRFPHSNRTYVKLKGALVAGGDIGMMQPQLAIDNAELLDTLSYARKHAWKIARIIGFGFLIKFLLRQVSMKDIEDTVLRVTGYTAKVVVNPYAEIAMDADKPHQVEMLREELKKLSGGAVGG
jgi:GTP:adenosylcobinamide-phosphate guanylyltransferase